MSYLNFVILLKFHIKTLITNKNFIQYSVNRCQSQFRKLSQDLYLHKKKKNNNLLQLLFLKIFTTLAF